MSNTLIVLGAGSSHPYGLPLGKDLLAQIVQLLPCIASLIEQQRNHVSKAKLGIIEERCKQLASKVARSRAPTVDTFLRSSPDDFLLIAMSMAIASAESQALRKVVAVSDDWLQWLYYNQLSQEPDIFRDNNIAFVSFNYDRLPQAIFASMMSSLCNIQPETALERIRLPMPELGDRFLHIHGELQSELRRDYDKNGVPYLRTDDIVPFSNTVRDNLLTMYNPTSDEMAAAIQQRIDWADRILFLGLGYHPELMRHISPDAIFEGDANRPIPCDIFGTAYGLSAQRRVAIEKQYSVAGETRIKLGGPTDGCLTLLINSL